MGAQQSMAVDRLHSILLEFTGTDVLPALMQKHGAVIAGSAVLWALDPQSAWFAHDIDIYVAHDHASALEAELRQHIAVEPSFVSFPYRCDKHLCTEVPWISHVRTLRMNDSPKKTVQLVVTTPGVTPLECVRTENDLSFLVNYYDGHTLVSVFPQHVKNKQGVLLQPLRQLQQKRIRKYERRGYKVVGLPHFTPYYVAPPARQSGF